jgi:hypothetical protein
VVVAALPEEPMVDYMVDVQLIQERVAVLLRVRKTSQTTVVPQTGGENVPSIPKQ